MANVGLSRATQAWSANPPAAAPAGRPLLDPRVPETDAFPLAAWRRCLRAVVTQ